MIKYLLGFVTALITMQASADITNIQADCIYEGRSGMNARVTIAGKKFNLPVTRVHDISRLHVGELARVNLRLQDLALLKASSGRVPASAAK